MDASTLSNLLAYSAQIAVVAAVGSLLPSLLRVDAAPVRYFYWRALLVLCLILPWVQGRHEIPAGQSVASTTTATPAVTALAAEVLAPEAFAFNWLALASGVLAAGACLRFLWLAAGLLRLRRLRAAGQLAAPCEEHDELQRLIAPAEIRYVAGIRQPLTFGAWRPVVLLPDTLRTHPPAIQRAVLCHELFHVQRRDWLWVLVEEAVRAVLWFHPGVWWIVSRIQLSREEVVDELAVLATGRRRTYIEALMAFSDDAPLAAATAFARQRHLFRRMVLISKEAVMSARRVVLSSAVMALTMVGGSWYVVGAFPMTQAGAATPQREPGTLEQQATPITPENPIPARLDAPAALYPASAAGARGSATLRITLDAFGRVAEARPVGFEYSSEGTSVGGSNPNSWDLEKFFSGRVSAGKDPSILIAAVEAFVRAADAAVRQWRYDPPKSAPITFDVKTTFAPDVASVSTQSLPFGGGMRVSVGRGGVAGGVTGGVRGGVGGGVAGPIRGTDTATGTTEVRRDGAVRVGSGIKTPTKIHDVRPVYPPEAMRSRIQGVVIVEARIDTDGSVSDVRVLRSIPLLDEAAVDAVRQWRFTPTLLNGSAVPVIMTMTVNFHLR